MTPSFTLQTSLLIIAMLLSARPTLAQERDTVTKREQERQSLLDDFRWPKVQFERHLKTYGDVKEALKTIDGLELLLQRGNDPQMLARPLSENFPVSGRADEMMVEWYHDVVADNALSESEGILIFAGHASRKPLETPPAVLLQQELKLIPPPGLTPILLEYKVSQFEITTDGIKLKPRTPAASYALFLSNGPSHVTVTLEALEPLSLERKGPSKIEGDLSLCLLSKPRKINADLTILLSLKQLQRFLRTGRHPHVARYGDFEIRFKSIERLQADAAQLTFELDYPDRPFYFESHMTPSLKGTTILTFPRKGDTPNTLTCERTGVNGQYETLDIVEETVQPVDWDLPVTGLEIEVPPLLKRLQLHIDVNGPSP